MAELLDQDGDGCADDPNPKKYPHQIGEQKNCYGCGK